MTRPSNLIYSVAEVPPALVCLISAIQHAAIVSPNLILPILVMRAGGATEQAVIQIVSLSLIALGAGAVLQSLQQRHIGSGYLISFTFTNTYYPVTIAALKTGGMPLVIGMTLLGGTFEIAMAHLIRRMRPFFPAEISGLCVLLISVMLGLLGIREIFGIGETGLTTGTTGGELALGLGTLALMVGLNVWSKGGLRMYCAIIGIAAGFAAGAAMGVVNTRAFAAASESGIAALPNWP